MKVAANDWDYVGRSTWYRLVRGAQVLLQSGKYGGKSWVGPSSFQAVQDELVAHRDPTLRAEWDGERCYLRASVCGRALEIHMREDLQDYEFEMSEGT